MTAPCGVPPVGVRRFPSCMTSCRRNLSTSSSTGPSLTRTCTLLVVRLHGRTAGCMAAVSKEVSVVSGLMSAQV